MVITIKKLNILLCTALVSLNVFSLKTYQASADAYTTTSIISQIESASQPNTSDLNDNGARNWLLANGKPCVQKTNAKNEITYKINTNDDYYKSIWQQAIKGWNDLGVIKLVPTNKKAEINLNIGGSNKNSDDYYAITNSSVDKKSANSNKSAVAYLINTNANLTHLNKLAKNYDFNVKTAEHELGHALGFEHDDTLNSTNNNYHIMHDGSSPSISKSMDNLGDYEKQTLLKYYK